MPVSVVRRATTRGVSTARVRRDARRLLAALGEERADLTVSLIGDAEMQLLNRDYRGRDRPTDVLAFALREGRRAPGDDTVLGDVVISLDTAARQARECRVPTDAEVRTLLIHGVLHLLGYDHEVSAVEARRMRALERHLLGSLALGDCRFSPDVGAIRESPHAAVPIRRAFSGGSRTAPTPKISEPEKIGPLERVSVREMRRAAVGAKKPSPESSPRGRGRKPG
jgi:probable rRNA maturation factor